MARPLYSAHFDRIIALRCSRTFMYAPLRCSYFGQTALEYSGRGAQL